MALVLMEGFEYSNVQQMAAHAGWFYRAYYGQTISISTGGRFGTRGVNVGVNVWDTDFGKTFPNNYETVIIGFAFKPDTFWGGGDNLFEVREGGITHLSIRRSTVNRDIYLMHGNGTWLAASQYGASPLYVWQYLEIKTRIHDTLGFVEVRLNGQTIINLTNIDTRNGGSGYFNTLYFGSSSGPICAVIDDLYVCDTTGTANNDFLGDVRVVKLLPSANGSVNNFIPSAGSNFQCVDELLNDGDTTTVTSSVAGDIDLYQVSDLTVTPSNIYGVQLESIARKTDTNIASFRNKMKIGNHIENDSEKFLALDHIPYDSPIYDLDPSTSTPWTKEKIDSLEIGVERLS